jgi:hypothetical protein
MGEMRDRDRYLVELGDRLRLPDDLRDDVLAEIADHLDDAIATSLADGIPAAEAERRAVESLGPVGAMAEHFRRTYQGNRRLLAAVGGSMKAGGRDAFRGFLGAYFFGLAFFTTLAVIAVLFRILPGLSDVDVGYAVGAAFFTSYQGLALCVAAWFGGGTLVSTLADRSNRRLERVAGPIAVVGGIALLFLVGRWEQAYDWPSVIAMSLIPLAFVIGALRAGRTLIPPTVQRRLVRASFVVTIVAMVGGLVGAILAPQLFSSSTSFETTPEESPESAAYWAATGYSVVAPTVIEPFTYLWDTFGSPGFTGQTEIDVDETWAGWARWTDVRAEAWRAMPDGERLEPGHVAPYASIKLDPSSPREVEMSLSKAGVDHYRLFVTATDRKTGERAAIGQSDGGDVVFFGSIIDWFRSL